MEIFKGISVWCIILAIVTIMIVHHIFSDNVIEGATGDDKTKLRPDEVSVTIRHGEPIIVPVSALKSPEDKKPPVKVVSDDDDSTPSKTPDPQIVPAGGAGAPDATGGDSISPDASSGGGGETNVILSGIETMFKKYFGNQQQSTTQLQQLQQQMKGMSSKPASVPMSTDKKCPDGYSPSADGINCSLIATPGSIEGETTTTTTPNIIGDQSIPMDDTEATPTPSPDKFFAILEEISDGIGVNSGLLKKLTQATDGSKSVLPKGSDGQKVADEVLNIKDCPSSQGSGLTPGGCVFLNHPANNPIKEMTCPKVYEKVVDSNNKTKYYRCKLVGSGDNKMCVRDISKDGLCKV